MCPYAHVDVKRVFMFISMCWLRVTVFRIRSVRSGLVAGDSDPIQIRARSGPDTMAIRRPAHGMIRKSDPLSFEKQFFN